MDPFVSYVSWYTYPSIEIMWSSLNVFSAEASNHQHALGKRFHVALAMKINASCNLSKLHLSAKGLSLKSRLPAKAPNLGCTKGTSGL